MKLLTLCLVGLSICGAYSAIPQLRKSCLAPNGGGLTSVLHEFQASIPDDKFADIVVKATSSDPQVKAIIDYFLTKEYSEAISGIVESQEFQDLVKFSCARLFVNASGILDYISPSDFAEFPQARYIRNRPGLVGMLLDILDLVPFDKLEESFNEKYSKDEYLREAVKNLDSEEFKGLVHNMESLPEAKAIYRKLQKIGVNFDDLKKTYYKFFYYIFDN